jgi:hypothetical protein
VLRATEQSVNAVSHSLRDATTDPADTLPDRIEEALALCEFVPRLPESNPGDGNAGYLKDDPDHGESLAH